MEEEIRLSIIYLITCELMRFHNFTLAPQGLTPDPLPTYNYIAPQVRSTAS
jgi:hypothetical protein